MSGYYLVAAFAPDDPADRHGRHTKTYEETLLAPVAAFNDFTKLVDSGKYDYVILEWIPPDDPAQDKEE